MARGCWGRQAVHVMIKLDCVWYAQSTCFLHDNIIAMAVMQFRGNIPGFGGMVTSQSPSSRFDMGVAFCAGSPWVWMRNCSFPKVPQTQKAWVLVVRSEHVEGVHAMFCEVTKICCHGKIERCSCYNSNEMVLQCLNCFFSSILSVCVRWCVL